MLVTVDELTGQSMGIGGLKSVFPSRVLWAIVLAVAAGLGMAAPASADDPPEWSTPVKPFRIAGNVYYVGRKGWRLIFIVSSQGAILLEGTSTDNAPLIERNIEAVGVPLHAVKRLISAVSRSPAMSWSAITPIPRSHRITGRLSANSRT